MTPKNTHGERPVPAKGPTPGLLARLQAAWAAWNAGAPAQPCSHPEALEAALRELREKEAALASAQRVWQGIEDSSHEWFWEQDAQYRFTVLKGGKNRPLVRPVGQMIGKRRWDDPAVTPLTCSWEEHRKVLDARQPFRAFEFRIGNGPDAQYISSSGIPAFDAAGTFIGYRGTALNVTKRVHAEEQARRSRAMLEKATRLGRLGAWAMELPERTLTWSSEALAIHGDGEQALTIERVLQLVHPDWRAALDDAVRACIREGTPFDIEARAYSAQDKLLWLRILGEPERGADGRVRRLHGAVQDITENKEAADRLSELSLRLTSVLDSVSDGFFTIDRSWRFTYVNRQAEKLLGRERSALLGQVVWDCFPASMGQAIHRQYERALAEQRAVAFEDYSAALACWIQANVYPSEHGLAVYFRDVSESRTVRLALAESEERYRMLFETSVDAIFQTAPDGTILGANPAACRLFGMNEDEMRQLGRGGLVDPRDARLQPLLDERARSGKASGCLTMVRRDGTPFEAEVTSSRYRASDGAVHTNVLVRDITHRLEIERKIRHLNEELSERVRLRTIELETANADLRAFAHSLAHDLRSPIAAVAAFGATLEESLATGGSDRDLHYVQRIRAAARRMDEFIEALLSLATISQMQLQMGQVDLSGAARVILAELQEREPGRRVQASVQDGLCVRGDPRLLRMALENLLGNAWKFTGQRPLAQIRFGQQQAPGGERVFCVEDNGAGFDMAYADKLFTAFQRLHAPAPFPGTGIGLANVGRIVAKHGGRIWAVGQEDAGAAFYFTLGT